MLHAFFGSVTHVLADGTWTQLGKLAGGLMALVAFGAILLILFLFGEELLTLLFIGGIVIAVVIGIIQVLSGHS